MAHKMHFWNTTVGRKYIMGITGLIWAGFVAAHLAGNLLIFVGEEAFNLYSHGLTSTKLVWVARGGLLAAFLAHIFAAICITIENRRARGGQQYSVIPNAQKKAAFASRWMAFHGSLILVFIILHLGTFTLGPAMAEGYVVTHGGVEMRDIYKLVIETFRNPLYVVWYCFALIFLGFHLSHGVYSTFQSLGLRNRVWEHTIQKFSYAYAVLIVAGFIAIPTYVYFVA
ncbi:MAG: succinate dehydrogenase cytochrome b subunit [Pseudobdellovibrionaceae bacterium]